MYWCCLEKTNVGHWGKLNEIETTDAFNEQSKQSWQVNAKVNVSIFLLSAKVSSYFHYGNQTQRMYGFSLIFGFSILAWLSLMASSSTWCTWYNGNSKLHQLNKVRNKFSCKFDYWMLANKTASLIFLNSWQSKYGKAKIPVFLNMNTLKSSMKMLFEFLLC